MIKMYMYVHNIIIHTLHILNVIWPAFVFTWNIKCLACRWLWWAITIFHMASWNSYSNTALNHPAPKAWREKCQNMIHAFSLGHQWWLTDPTRKSVRKKNKLPASYIFLVIAIYYFHLVHFNDHLARLPGTEKKINKSTQGLEIGH